MGLSKFKKGLDHRNGGCAIKGGCIVVQSYWGVGQKKNVFVDFNICYIPIYRLPKLSHMFLNYQNFLGHSV